MKEGFHKCFNKLLEITEESMIDYDLLYRQMELMKKGVSSEIIEEVLNSSERNDEEEILKIIAKKRAKYDDEKLTAYLCRQGFPYQLVNELVQSYGKD